MTASSRKEHHLRLLVAAILAALVLAPAALAAPPDVVTHTNIDRTSTIGVCGFPVLVHSRASSRPGSTSTTTAPSSANGGTSSGRSR